MVIKIKASPESKVNTIYKKSEREKAMIHIKKYKSKKAYLSYYGPKNIDKSVAFVDGKKMLLIGIHCLDGFYGNITPTKYKITYNGVGHTYYWKSVSGGE